MRRARDRPAHVLRITSGALSVSSTRISPNVADHLIKHPELLNVGPRLVKRPDGEIVPSDSP